MNALKIEIKPADKPLQDYQVELIYKKKNKFEILIQKVLWITSLNGHIKSGKADDFEVLCRDGEKFGVHLYCLFNSDFLYKQYKARENFSGKGNRFDKIYMRRFYLSMMIDTPSV